MVTPDKHGKYAAGVQMKYLKNNNFQTAFTHSISLSPAAQHDYSVCVCVWHWNGRPCLPHRVPFLGDELDKLLAADGDITVIDTPLIYCLWNMRMGRHGVICPSTINNGSHTLITASPQLFDIAAATVTVNILSICHSETWVLMSYWVFKSGI